LYTFAPRLEHVQNFQLLEMAPGKGGYRQINKTLNICAFEDYLEGQQTLLPKIQGVEKISPLVIRVLGQNPGKACIIRCPSSYYWINS
jgi:hypothetical protein